MEKDDSLKNKIIELRKLGFSYNKIVDKLNCSKGIVSYHCRNNDLYDIGLGNEKINGEVRKKITEYYKTHTAKETAKFFNISISSVKYYNNESKIHKYNNEEKKKINYKKLKYYRHKLKEMSVNYKGGCCEICGYDKCINALEFHHKDPKEKDFSPSGKSYSWERVKNEIEKCILVCANCHREIHHTDRT
jgi:DNA-binding CsgD family transcriptional regulator